MHILNELNILQRRILFQIGYGWKPYIGKIYYKVNEWDPSYGAIVSFYTKQSRWTDPFRFEIQMRFEMDFPGYRILDLKDCYTPTTNQTVYIAQIYNNEYALVGADEINKLFTNHPDYELNNDSVII